MPTSNPLSSIIRPWRQRPSTQPLPYLLALATLWCLLLLAGRIVFTGLAQYQFLVWNLFLAAIPLFWSRRLSASQTAARFWGCAFLWLLFFPNAPYVVTDLIHLHRKSHPAIPVWYDVGMLGNFAAVALIFGLVSLRQVHSALEQRISPLSATLLVTAAAFLAGFGIYLGRFLRWNSWDIVTRPWLLAGDIADRLMNPFDHPRTWVVTLMFGGMIALLHWISQAASEPDR